MNCVLSETLEQELTESFSPLFDPPCFDVAYVQTNCTPVFLNVNVHFFLDDNCEGDLAAGPEVQEDLSPENAYVLAEELIIDANSFFEIMSENPEDKNHQWNASEHGAVPTTAQCIPFRYVLSGVYIHCDSDAQETNAVSFSLYDPYLINEDTEINVFIASNNTGNGAGFASNSGNKAMVENFNLGLFQHELGHVFNLRHTFIDDVNGGDDCDDTWDHNWEWDSDCDEEPDVFDDKCWSNMPKHNGDDACDTQLFCEKHPCCEWSIQNNNLMTYSAWQGNPNYCAITPCQITRALTDISGNMCDYVEGVGTCPPPKAFIGIIPTLDQTLDCPACFYLNASFNESLYSIRIVDQFEATKLNTGNIFAEAGKFCITPGMKHSGPFWPYGLEAEEPYTLRLRVQNECGDFHVYEYEFELPEPCDLTTQPAPEPHLEVVMLSPNPTSSQLTITFNLDEDGLLKIFGVNSNYSTFYGLVDQQNLFQGDNQQLAINVSNWDNGINSLIFEFGGEIYIENFVKQ